jgi:hypothetical protein
MAKQINKSFFLFVENKILLAWLFGPFGVEHVLLVIPDLTLYGE